MGMVAREHRMVDAAGAQLCTEAFGGRADPPILLVMGQMASMLWWPEELCERLAAAGRYVIRYDHRDTGLSSASPPGQPDYTGDDLAGDVARVLDGYGIESAHIAGMSMGGMLAQLVAIRHPRRVSSLTLISTTLAAGGGDLPPPSPAYLESAAGFEGADLTDPAQLIELIVADSRALTGAGREFDEARVRAFVEADIARARSPESLANHQLLGGDELEDDALSRVECPVLVVHGTSDPLFPKAHAQALAQALDAELVLLDGAGHELHADDRQVLAEAILGHTAPGARARG